MLKYLPTNNSEQIYTGQHKRPKVNFHKDEHIEEGKMYAHQYMHITRVMWWMSWSSETFSTLSSSNFPKASILGIPSAAAAAASG